MSVECGEWSVELEKVIEGLSSIHAVAVGDGAFYVTECGMGDFNRLLAEAVQLLKGQEPVEPRVGHDGWYRCGGCNNPLASGERVKHLYGRPWPKYCEKCGKAVKWG